MTAAMRIGDKRFARCCWFVLDGDRRVTLEGGAKRESFELFRSNSTPPKEYSVYGTGIQFTMSNTTTKNLLLPCQLQTKHSKKRVHFNASQREPTSSYQDRDTAE